MYWMWTSQIQSFRNEVQIIAGIESRGFLFAPMIACRLQLPFIPIRKPGKLPGRVITEEYVLEYGTDTLCIQEHSVRAGQRVVIIDDLLATGGTLSCALSLFSKLGLIVVQCAVLIELNNLQGRSKIMNTAKQLQQHECQVYSFIQY